MSTGFLHDLPTEFMSVMIHRPIKQHDVMLITVLEYSLDVRSNN